MAQLGASGSKCLRAAVRESARIVVSPDSWAGGESASNLTQVAVGGTLFLGGHCIEGLRSSVIWGQKPSSVPCYVSLSIGQLTT